MLLRDPKWLPLIAIYGLFEGRRAKDYPPGDARKYAELTGGQAVRVRGNKNQERLGQTIDELRARYTVGYSPSESRPAGTFCKLRVELAPGGALRTAEWTVLARQGYYRK